MTGKLTGGWGLAGVDRGKTPLDGRFMGLDVVDLFFNLNLPGFQSFLPGFQSFKCGDDFIEFLVRSHNIFLFGCIQIPNASIFVPYDIANFTLDQLLGTNQGGRRAGRLAAAGAGFHDQPELW
jgi:hypothetical protein